MSYKRDNPGSPCCNCCPLYEFEDSSSMGTDSNLRFDVNATSPAQSTSGISGKSAEFTGSSYYKLTQCLDKTWPYRRSPCFTPSVIDRAFATEWYCKFAMKVISPPPDDMSEMMGVVTRGAVTGTLPSGTFTGEWGAFYRHSFSAPNLEFAIKTSSGVKRAGRASVSPSTASTGPGAHGFYEITWTIKGSTGGNVSTVTVSGSTHVSTFSLPGTLLFDNSDFYIGNNVNGLKLGEATGAEILLDQVSVGYK